MHFNWLCLFLCLITLPTKAQIISELVGHKTHQVSELTKGKSLWVFFKPDCPVCFRLASSLDCLTDKTKVLWVGFSASRRVLWRETKKMKLSSLGFGQVLLANKEILSSWKVKADLTPQLLFVEEGKIVKRHLGFLSCQEIRKNL